METNTRVSRDEWLAARRNNDTGQQIETPWDESFLMDWSHCALPPTVASGGVEFSFQEVGTHPVLMSDELYHFPLYWCSVRYSGTDGIDRELDISTCINPQKPILFAGNSDGAFLASDLKDDAYPYYILEISPSALLSRPQELSSVWHELGHIVLFHHQLDEKLLNAATNSSMLPSIAQAQRYVDELSAVLRASGETIQTGTTQEIVYSILNNRDNPARVPFLLVGERNAWASGLKLARKYELPTGFSSAHDLRENTHHYLAEYGKIYNDTRFDKGIR